MRILIVHNRYQQPGGEDISAAQDAMLLRDAGHEVIEYSRSNDEIKSFGLLQKLALPKQIIWASDTVRDLRNLLQWEKPDVVHFHNTFVMVSPAAYHVCHEVGIPVVQALHNPRLMCPAATFYRDGGLCQDCLGKDLAWPGVLHACYRDSHIMTAGVAAMVTAHRWLRTWENQVDTYLVWTELYRKKFIEGGLPADKIIVNPQFLYSDPGRREGRLGNYALFIGRLGSEKGVRTLLQAWRQVGEIPLKIRGDGPLIKEVQDIQSHLASVDLVGRLSKEDLISLVKGARFLVWPSEGYSETFGLVAVEAFACGVPVIASRTGVMTEMVEDKRTGLHFTPGDPDDLAAKVRWAVAHPAEVVRMGHNARAEFEAKYTAERYYQKLMDIYRSAITRKAGV